MSCFPGCPDCRCDTVDVAASAPSTGGSTKAAGAACTCFPANDVCPSGAKCSQRTVYIAGPMTGIEEYNYPAFHAAAARWRDAGWRVFNPAEHTLPTPEQEASMSADEIRALYMRKDIEWVMDSDAVALLPGWQASKGAQAEVAVASVLNLALLDAETMGPWSETILAEADRLTSSDRQATYGHPMDDFARTAKMMTGVLLDKLRPEIEVSVEDVPLLMNCVKMSREVNHPKRDNRTDGAGYWKTLDMVYTERARRAA